MKGRLEGYVGFVADPLAQGDSSPLSGEPRQFHSGRSQWSAGAWCAACAFPPAAQTLQRGGPGSTSARGPSLPAKHRSKRTVRNWAGSSYSTSKSCSSSAAAASLAFELSVTFSTLLTACRAGDRSRLVTRMAVRRGADLLRGPGLRCADPLPCLVLNPAHFQR
jgi:hypothetical protein